VTFLAGETWDELLLHNGLDSGSETELPH